MRGLLAAALLFCTASLTLAAPQAAARKEGESWTSIFIQGAKVGYSRSEAKAEGSGRRVETSTLIRAEMLGSRLEMEIETTSPYNAKGAPTRMESVTSSGGRVLKVTADFTPSSIIARSVSGGQTTTKTIPIRPEWVITDDPASYVVQAEGTQAKQTPPTFKVFDPNSLSLVDVKVTDEGPGEVVKLGQTFKGRKVTVDDPRAPMTLWLDGEGELIIAQGPLGMEMIPQPKEEAMKLSGTADIAEASAIRSSKPLDLSRKSATLIVRGASAKRFQNGPGQKVEQKGPDVVITLQPLEFESNIGTLKVGQAGGKEAWTKPEMRVPSNNPDIKKQAQRIIGRETNAIRAAELVRRWLQANIGVNAGIGVMRDAREVMETKEGVCRDHAVLMAALLRSVGIPTQLTSGIVYQSGQFYYHAWVEVWNGKSWVPMDSTRPGSRLTVGHVKIASGSVADAYVSFLIEQKVIEVAG